MTMSDLISRPSEFYSAPDDILTATGLRREQKRKALENWKQTCIQLQESTSEGMEGSDQAENLRLVSQAISKLCDLRNF